MCVCVLMVLLVKLFVRLWPNLILKGIWSPITRLSDALFGPSTSVGPVRVGSQHGIWRRSHGGGDSATKNYFDGQIRSA
jgi:hypothetical protein